MSERLYHCPECGESFSGEKHCPQCGREGILQ